MSRLRNRASARGEDQDVRRVSVKDVDGWVNVLGDDVLTPQVIERHRAWEQAQEVHSTLTYRDTGFLPGPRAVDGQEEIDMRTNIFKATMSESATRARGGVDGGEIYNQAPMCLCGQPARLGTLRKQGAAKGRPYWRCASRNGCRFFELADRGSTLAAMELTWVPLGPPQWVVVGDEGFRPEHLRQGGVGDCWFMSALAVVAERHDLLEKLLPNLNEGLASGCHEVRLFLDGRWTAALVDNNFPMAAPGKQRRLDETGLAFGRAAEHQLWVPLIEKAYARAHGAYKSISGGQVSEAMLDLTGCPTEAVNFRVPGFDKELFWGRLLSFIDAGFPVGCGTSEETVEELGLVGQHAYSVLEAREAIGCFPDVPSEMSQRMVKVRNPWGEWTRKEVDEVLQSLGAAITADGAFWMNYNDFIRGFAGADICKARMGWHARSFDVGFADGLGTGMRRILRVQATERTELYIMAIQPTERGARLKRARGYYLNDVSYALLDAASGNLQELVLGGARRDVSSESVFIEPGHEYIVAPFSFKARAGSCVVRLYASCPVSARLADAAQEEAALVWSSVHQFAMRPQQDLGKRVQRMMHRVYSEISGMPMGRLLLLEGESLAMGILVNEQLDVALHVSISLEANHMVARTADGLTEGVSRPAKKEQKQKLPKGKGKGKADSEDWHEFKIQAVVLPKSQQLVFAMIPCMRMHGDYDLSLVDMQVEEQPVSSTGVQKKLPRGHPFAATEFASAKLAALPSAEDVGVHIPFIDDDVELLAAISASLADTSGKFDNALPQDQATSLDILPDADNASFSPSGTEDPELLAAISASLAEADVNLGTPSVQEKAPRMEKVCSLDGSSDASSDMAEEDELELALALSLVDPPPLAIEAHKPKVGNDKSCAIESSAGKQDCHSSNKSLARTNRWTRNRAAQ
mmetsp:Transcript_43849/g.82244  ORF Transcript_43849/g.82244 Transcript_43849/m.82244 type:complete len:921 (+) Transcript_43849:168-2930(+)